MGLDVGTKSDCVGAKLLRVSCWTSGQVWRPDVLVRFAQYWLLFYY